MKKERILVIGIIIASLLLAIGCDLGGLTYAIGDTGPSGVGLVFYVTDGGLHGLEVAPDDQSTSSSWSNITNLEIGTTGTAIGTGYANTEAIIDQQWHTASAAKICRDYTGGGKTDWFLPSRDELNAIWENIVNNGDGEKIGLSGDPWEVYWSSTEHSSSTAWFQSLNIFQQTDWGKGLYRQVRAVRAF